MIKRKKKKEIECLQPPTRHACMDDFHVLDS